MGRDAAIARKTVEVTLVCRKKRCASDNDDIVVTKVKKETLKD